MPTKKKATAPKNTTKKTGTYTADNISVLEGLEPVRKRPGMYIGTTGLDGLHHLIWEIFDNSRDEAMAGYSDHIEVALLPNNRIRVADNGRGIPVGIHKKTKVSALETIMTTLHAGGKFDSDAYKVSSGLHGVGASVVNALSLETSVLVHQDGGLHKQDYVRGKPKTKVKKIDSSKMRGTIISFIADGEIFPEIRFDYKKIVDHMRQQAYLVKGLRIVVIDARQSEKMTDIDSTFYIEDLGLDLPSQTFYFEGGLLSLVHYYNKYQKPVHRNIFYAEQEIDKDQVGVEIALQYVDDISSRVTPFANNVYTAEGGMHVTGFKTALTRVINTYVKKNKLIKESDGAFTGDDVLEGLTVVVSVKLEEIQFEGQTKGRLGSVEARGAVEKFFGDKFSDFLEENPDDARQIVNKITLALHARKAAKAAKDSVLRQGALEGMTLPGKLADCSSRSAEESELFIVEGDSAGGSAKQGRDRKTQAILPLRGKILNVERARLDKMLASKEVKALVIALGASIGDAFDLEKMRYHKIIIATDADVDGAHISTLLLTFFYRYFKQVIDAGYLYIAQPPLYKIKKGKEISYAYTEAEKQLLVGDINPEDTVDNEDTDNNVENSVEDTEEKTATKKSAKLSIQRYKGLGEMNPEELWETTMDPETRTLKQISVEDIQEADRVFDMLMGTEVPPRKNFIQKNAQNANVDV